MSFEALKKNATFSGKNQVIGPVIVQIDGYPQPFIRQDIDDPLFDQASTCVTEKPSLEQQSVLKGIYSYYDENNKDFFFNLIDEKLEKLCSYLNMDDAHVDQSSLRQLICFSALMTVDSLDTKLGLPQFISPVSTIQRGTGTCGDFSEVFALIFESMQRRYGLFPSVRVERLNTANEWNGSEAEGDHTWNLLLAPLKHAGGFFVIPIDTNGADKYLTKKLKQHTVSEKDFDVLVPTRGDSSVLRVAVNPSHRSWKDVVMNTLAGGVVTPAVVNEVIRRNIQRLVRERKSR